MRIKFKTRRQLYTTSAIVSFIVALTVYYFLSSNNFQYDIKILKVYHHPQEMYNNIYRDLDHDGLLERILITNPSEELKQNNINNIQVIGNNNIAEEQYNFGDYYSQPTSLFTADINNDNYDDLIYFYDGKDTLFLSIIDHKNRKILVKNHVVYLRPKEARKGYRWLPEIYCHFYKKKKGEYGYIYFTIATGYPIFPRGIYKLNLSTLQIEKKFESGANIIDNVIITDLDKDGHIEIVASSTATNNTPNLSYKLKYDDTVSHIFLFDEELNLKYHKTYNTDYGGAYIIKLPQKSEDKIFLVYRDDDERGVFHIQLLSKTLSIVVDKRTNLSHAYFPVYFNKRIIISDINKTLVYNDKLERVKQLYLEGNKINFLMSFYAEGKEFIWGANEKNIFLINGDLDIVGQFKGNFAGVTGRQANRNKFKNNEFPGKELFSIRSYKKEFIITYKENQLYKYLGLIIPVVFIFTFVGITGARKVYISLFKYYSVFKYIVPKSENGIIIINEFGEIIFVNGTAQFLLNTTSDNIKNKRVVDAEIDEELKEFICEGIKKGEQSEKVITFISKKKSVKLKVILYPLKTEFNSVIGHLLTLNDLTHHLLKERSDILSHSIQKVAHEIKTPLSSILLNLDSIENEINSNPENSADVVRDLNIVRKEIERIKGFTNNFLKFANLRKPNFQYVTAAELIYNSLLKFESYLLRDIRIEKEIEDNLIIWADPYQIEEALQILIENAIDAVRGKGKIKIVCKRKEGKACFYIEDNGSGIPNGIRKTLFDPYVTTKPEGTGMGLSIAKKILEDHDSILQFDSSPEGTVFWFEIKLKVNEEGKNEQT